MDPTVAAGEEAKADAGKGLSGMESTGAGEEDVGDLHAQVHGVEEAGRLFAFLIDDLGAEVDEDFRDVDFDGADFVASSAEGRGIGQRWAWCICMSWGVRMAPMGPG